MVFSAVSAVLSCVDFFEMGEGGELGRSAQPDVSSSTAIAASWSHISILSVAGEIDSALWNSFN